jgi:hypothetical protein
MIPIIGSKFFLKEDDPNLINVRNKWASTHDIEVVWGTKVILANLHKNEAVAYGDGKTYHFRLIKK